MKHNVSADPVLPPIFRHNALDQRAVLFYIILLDTAAFIVESFEALHMEL